MKITWYVSAVLGGCLACLLGCTTLLAGPEALEVGPDRAHQLPGGKEADGIAGDFVIRNSRIEALISGNLPGRTANFTTHYRETTSGSVYDLSVRGSHNDQLTLFAPGNLRGPVSWVKVVSDGSNGVAEVETERTAARGGGVRQVHRYRLERGWRYLLVVSSYQNLGKKPVLIDPSPVLKGLKGRHEARGISFGDAMDPMDRQGYACASVDWPGAAGDLRKGTLLPGQSRTSAVALAPGFSPAEAFGAIARLRGPTGVLRGQVVEKDGGGPVLSATVSITLDGKSLPAYPRADGSFEVFLPPGSYPVTVKDIGRPDLKRAVEVKTGEVEELRIPMDPPSRVRFAVTDAEDPEKQLPCKVQFLGLGGTPDPNLGVAIRAHGCDHQYHSEKGRFTVQLPPGKYRVIITRGIEYSHHDTAIQLPPGEEVTVRASLRRVVDTRGWISTDYHNHSTPSGDNYCGTDDRIINLAAEQVEFAPATEHNRLYDWLPHIRKLGLEKELATISGMELTGRGPHLNSFPLRPTPHTQDNGAPTWVEDPRINAIVLRDLQGGEPDRWVHLNHPAVGRFFRDRDNDGVPDGGYADLEKLVDAAEVWSTEILNLSPTYKQIRRDGKVQKIENRTFAWLQLLNQGRRVWCIAVSDAHSVFSNGVGGWRTYVPSSTDEPDRIDYREIIRNSKAGRMLVTNGPFLELRLEDGTLPGGSTRASGTVTCHVRVQTTTWIDIDRVQLLVNGRPLPELNFTTSTHPEYFRKDGALCFRGALQVPLQADAHLIAVASGEESNLSIGYGRSWQSRMHPCAFTNPIFIDVDGNGFEPSGDTLGYPLPVGPISEE